MTAKTLFTIALVAIFSGCDRQTNNTSAEADSTATDNGLVAISEMQGTWVHTEDSLSVVEIKGNEWAFRYAGRSGGDSDNYNVTITHSLPPSVYDSTESSFMILGNPTDTMHYKITSLSRDTMILLYYPRENIHVYRRSKGR